MNNESRDIETFDQNNESKNFHVVNNDLIDTTTVGCLHTLDDPMKPSKFDCLAFEGLWTCQENFLRGAFLHIDGYVTISKS